MKPDYDYWEALENAFDLGPESGPPERVYCDYEVAAAIAEADLYADLMLGLHGPCLGAR